MSDDFDEVLALVNGAGAAAGARPQPAHPAGCGWAAARAIARDAVTPGEPTEIPLDRALHHTLAAPLAALTDLPAFDTAAMDGWAVSGPGPWLLTVPPGEPGILAGADPDSLPDGHAVPIATGARIPRGATAVLRSEHGAAEGDRLAAPASPPQGTDIRPRGQECRAGDLLLPAGATVTPAVLGLAAAAGYDVLTVTRRPRVEVLVLGDELLHQGTPRDGRIRDALGPMLAPWLTALGADVLATRQLGDDADALYKAVTTTTADLVVSTGGTASGPVDHVHPTLARIGATLLVDGVAVRPGHPMLLAALPDEAGRHLIGLPGNPLAAVSGLLTLAEPLLRTLADRNPDPEPVTARLTDAAPGHPQDTRLVPVIHITGEARPLRYHGPAMLRGIASATALAVIPPGGATPGTAVELLELPWA
ncbi:molybdopterin molybdotransferase MoeA [Streptomyces gobiensis]|uniref:molybdopterin molybdotransferase MoeA n=1 Tax=Streptomyces gobiensis TaxID=2875706 RepID=UPI001E581E85|nr:molybdopterin molybdotransferase MoeA [Streptomyces gobiensis]UGY92639.1 molybdopterin molybdotransferase MoeA [Streptomyces gobiensis]